MTRYTTSTLPRNCGPAAWNAILEPQAPAVTLDTSTNADFVVIGAGFAGLSAARRLTQLEPGAKVVLLEAGRVASGAAGRNSGFMIDLPHDLSSESYAGAGDDRKVIALNRKAIAFARAAVEEYGIDHNYFDPAGKVNGAVSEEARSNNEKYARHLASLDETCEMLDAVQMHELTGSSHYNSGLFTKGTVMLQPAGYIRGLAAGLIQQGIEIFENSPVRQFKRDATGWVVETDKAVVNAPKVILTVNGHLESFGIHRNRLLQLFLFATMTPELDKEAISLLGGAPRWGVTPSDPMGTTMRRIDRGQGGDRIVTRTCAVVRPNMRNRPSDLKRATSVMRRKFDQRFPQLAGVRMEYEWAGHLCLSLNGVSVTGEIDKGVFSGCVQNGLGTTRGTLTGIAAAELACGAQSDISYYFSAEADPRRLPPQPFREIGANALLRWKEWKATEE